MKIIFFLLISFQAFSQSVSRNQIESILRSRQIQLSQLEAQGQRLLIGEVTGAGRSLPLNRVQIFITNDQAILSHEIESYDVKTPAALGNLSSLRSSGVYYLSSDIKAVLIK
jgi:hypothetical protein